jgi:hypothetical protein
MSVTVKGLRAEMYPHLKPLSCWRATMPYLSSPKASITTGPGTCPHVSTFTGFDHGTSAELPGVCFLGVW